MPSADLPRPFTDVTRAVLVDWLIQVHVSLTAEGRFLLPLSKAGLTIQIMEGHSFLRFRLLRPQWQILHSAHLME